MNGSLKVRVQYWQGGTAGEEVLWGNTELNSCVHIGTEKGYKKVTLNGGGELVGG